MCLWLLSTRLLLYKLTFKPLHNKEDSIHGKCREIGWVGLQWWGNWGGSKGFASFSVWMEERQLYTYAHDFGPSDIFLCRKNTFLLLRFYCLLVLCCFHMNYCWARGSTLWENFKNTTAALRVQPSQSMKIPLYE